MPYTLLQGGRRRRRRRGGVVLAVIVLAVAATLFLADRAGQPQKPKPTTTAPPGPLKDSTTAPLAGGGTAPSPLAVRMDDPRDAVPLALQAPAALGAAVRR